MLSVGDRTHAGYSWVARVMSSDRLRVGASHTTYAWCPRWPNGGSNEVRENFKHAVIEVEGSTKRGSLRYHQVITTNRRSA